jgi:hypothetical protein
VPRGWQPTGDGYGSVLAVDAPSTVIFIPATPTMMLAIITGEKVSQYHR